MGVIRYSAVNGILVSQSNAGTYNRLLRDTLGNVVAVSDSGGVKSHDTNYWPYGEVRNGGVSDVTHFGFCGVWGYYLDSSARVYVRARHYRQIIARWQTVDPKWPLESYYGYVDSKPLLYADPSGLGIGEFWDSVLNVLGHGLDILDTGLTYFCAGTSGGHVPDPCFECAKSLALRMWYTPIHRKHHDYIHCMFCCELSKRYGDNCAVNAQSFQETLKGKGKEKEHKARWKWCNFGREVAKSKQSCHAGCSDEYNFDGPPFKDFGDRCDILRQKK